MWTVKQRVSLQRTENSFNALLWLRGSNDNGHETNVDKDETFPQLHA